MFKNKRMLIAVICILGACVVAAASIFTQKISLGNKSEVVVLQRDVKRGEQISVSDVSIEKRTSTEVSEIALTDLNLVVGSYATSNLFTNDVVTPSKISSTPVNGDSLISTMADDKIAISVPVSGANGLNGKLESGDIVQVYIENPEYNLATEEERLNMDEMVLSQELQYMKIISITFSDVTEEDTKLDGGTYSVVTFECSQYQANKLIDASTRGLYLGYICHGDDERAAGLLEAQSTLNQQFSVAQ